MFLQKTDPGDRLERRNEDLGGPTLTERFLNNFLAIRVTKESLWQDLVPDELNEFTSKPRQCLQVVWFLCMCLKYLSLMSIKIHSTACGTCMRQGATGPGVYAQLCHH